jgi:hypothetical protein
MEACHLQHLLRRLPSEGISFPYFKDRYALMLLSYFVREERYVRDVKSSRFAGLLAKSTLKDLARHLSDGRITRSALEGVRHRYPVEFVLTLDRYGVEHSHPCQTSRGEMNLVVQVNFPAAHDRAMRRMLAPGDESFTLEPYSDHPVSSAHNTMAWVRIDLDPCSEEALIEEVQNDWIRNVLDQRGVAEMLLDDDDGVRKFQGRCGTVCAPRDFLYYCDRVLRPYAAIWSEAALAAAIWFLVEKLGMRRIFYHTHVSGAILKGADDAPISLYSDLPRRFCFREVRECPEFLIRQASLEHRPVDGERVPSEGEGHTAAVTSRVPFYLLDLN